MLDIKFIGPPLEEGPLPAVFYFAVSAYNSLYTDPFNQPVEALISSPLRIFSITLPSHDLYSIESALQNWADKIQSGTSVIDKFLEEATEEIFELYQKNYISPKQLAVMGLSRGAFIATHIMARLKEIEYLLGFAPLTKLKILKEFRNIQDVEKWDLVHLVDNLINKPIRYYIGNHDTRVSTAAAFHFITSLAEKTYPKHRSPPVELFIKPSLGKDGHGTSLSTFQEGALWLKNHLLGVP